MNCQSSKADGCDAARTVVERRCLRYSEHWKDFVVVRGQRICDDKETSCICTKLTVLKSPMFILPDAGAVGSHFVIATSLLALDR